MRLLMLLSYLLLCTPICLHSQDLFYKTINSDQAKDSLQKELVNGEIDFIYFSPDHWENKDSLSIGYKSAHLFIYLDSALIRKSVLVSEYFIYTSYLKTSEAFDYFLQNSDSLMNSRLRPDERDLEEVYFVLDTAIAQMLNIDLSKELSKSDSAHFFVHSPNYKHYRPAIGGLAHQKVLLFDGTSSHQISIDQESLRPQNYYYQFNCKLPIYTLRLLLQKAFDSMVDEIETHLELKEYGLLDSLGRLDPERNPDHFEKVFEKQIQYWIDRANQELDKNWKLKK